MDKIFESIDSNEDYEQIANKIFYKENLDKIESKYSEKEYLELDNSVKKKIASELNLNFKFILTFGVSITAFYPIVESFILNSGIEEININKETVVYLSICALAITFGNPKESYRKLFSELRLRNVYGLLKDLTTFIKLSKNLFNYFISTVGRITYDIIGMFNYTILFVPFALTLSSILNENEISLESIQSAITDDGVMKFTTLGIGVTSITIRELIVSLFTKMKDFKFDKYKNKLSKSFISIKGKVQSNINKLKTKIKIDKIDKDLKNKEEPSPDDVISWSDWKDKNGMDKDVERIDEEI